MSREVRRLLPIPILKYLHRLMHFIYPDNSGWAHFRVGYKSQFDMHGLSRRNKPLDQFIPSALLVVKSAGGERVSSSTKNVPSETRSLTIE